MPHSTNTCRCACLQVFLCWSDTVPKLPNITGSTEAAVTPCHCQTEVFTESHTSLEDTHCIHLLFQDRNNFPCPFLISISQMESGCDCPGHVKYSSMVLSVSLWITAFQALCLQSNWILIDSSATSTQAGQVRKMPTKSVSNDTP